MIRKLLEFIFKSHLEELNNKSKEMQSIINQCREHESRIKDMVNNIDVSVDVHEFDHRYSPSWAVISLQGHKADYIKFVNLGDADIHNIGLFLRRYERSRNIKVDATPQTSKFLRVRRS